MVRAPAPAAGGFRVDLAALQALVTPRTRAIFFATPNNPSGVILSDTELEALGELAQRHRLWLVADEVYAGLAPGGRVPSLAARLPDQVITIGSLSKTHAMPGWRAGWMVAPQRLVEHVQSLAMCMLYGLPGFIQEAALTAMGVAPDAEARIRDYCVSRRDLLLAGLEGVRQLRCMAPAAGMFMLVDVQGTGLTGREFVAELYRAEKVSVIDGGAFGQGTRDFVRVCFAADEAQLRDACRRIRRFVASRPVITPPAAARSIP
jgi:aspartate/methionine/tyrosine aminotransferase